MNEGMATNTCRIKIVGITELNVIL